MRNNDVFNALMWYVFDIDWRSIHVPIEKRIALLELIKKEDEKNKKKDEDN